jgi:protein involved in polysaccharide export with SLBB domain
MGVNMQLYISLIIKYLLLSLLVGSVGCAGKEVVPLLHGNATMRTKGFPKYYLQPGDNLEIKFFYNPELNDSPVVRPDGKISLQLIDDVHAAGLTPVQLDEALTEKYSKQLKQAEVTVMVRDTAGLRIYVSGEVRSPGEILIKGPITALEAIVQAGGFDALTAKAQNVLIIRHKDDHRSGYSLDLRAALKGKEVEPFYLEPYDIVYVPQTTIVKLNQWITQHINEIVPYGFQYTKRGRSYSIGVDSSRD